MSARGHRHRNSLRIVCDLDDDTFSEIKARAEREGTTMAAEIRQLIEWGLMAGDGSGAAND